MPTIAWYAQQFQTYNPSGGGYEEWNMYCEAFVHRMAAMAAGVQKFPQGFTTARGARLASGPLNTNMAQIQPGDIGWWEWSDQDHTAVWTGDRWMMGSRHVTEQWGGVAGNAGTVTHADFQARAGLPFLGFSKTSAGRVVPVTVAGPPPGAVRKWNAPGDPANLRSEPRVRAGTIVGSIPGGDWGDFNAWCHGVAPAGSTNDVWLRGAYSNPAVWAWSGSFTDTATQGLPEVPSPLVVVPDPIPGGPVYSPADLSSIVEITAEHFAAMPWIRFEVVADPDEAVDPLVKNKADWNYYREKYGVDEPYFPRRSIVHWWDDPSAEPTHDGVVSYLRTAADLSADFVTSPGRITRMGSMLTASYTTGQNGMSAWSSENDPRLTEWGYVTLAALHYVVEEAMPHLKNEAITRHNQEINPATGQPYATSCSPIDTAKIREIVDEFRMGRRSLATGLLVVEEPEPEPEGPTDPGGDGAPDSEPEEPGEIITYPPLTKGDVDTVAGLIPQVSVDDRSVKDLGENLKPETRKGIYSFWTVLGLCITGVLAGSVAAATAVVGVLGLPSIPPEWKWVAWPIGIFAFIAGAYAALTPQVTALSRVNTPRQ